MHFVGPILSANNGFAIAVFERTAHQIGKSFGEMRKQSMLFEQSGPVAYLTRMALDEHRLLAPSFDHASRGKWPGTVRNDPSGPACLRIEP